MGFEFQTTLTTGIFLVNTVADAAVKLKTDVSHIAFEHFEESSSAREPLGPVTNDWVL